MARKANVSDMFKIVRLLNDLDMKDDINSIYKNEKSVQEKGFDLIFKILEKASMKETEKRVYEVLSGPFEMKAEDVSQLDLDNLIELCQESFVLKNVINFIERVSN